MSGIKTNVNKKIEIHGPAFVWQDLYEELDNVPFDTRISITVRKGDPKDQRDWDVVTLTVPISETEVKAYLSEEMNDKEES